MTEQKIVLITGANKGIGYATARVLGQAGNVVFVGARDPERGTKAAAELVAEGLDARFVRLDVTDLGTVEAAADLVDREFGRLDLLVNNAAVTRDQHHRPSEMPVDLLREVYETNVLGVVAVTNAMLPLLRRSAAGRIANVSSGLGTFAFLTDSASEFRAYATLLGYNSSKAALNAVTLMYAEELRDTPIKVNAVSPGFCATDLNGFTGVLPADEGGAHVARQATMPDAPTGVFLSELGGVYPW
ncbi:SDR family oxidoreductase [Nonomuraea jiangxiensis]|uniref:NAD(P)-dependent dehydrogenase, short-chain alcohol dehydrogenase family n=1 Tax=Nonomuraea jiangxiensis TaxID=633440 RepID=A0A1G9KGA8_9ACTN|nr:SDR family oxidoreductase [Nonomuraea jiangxiensis]SDL48626.1 NAD(P)-dependent dehydrogenase, short-chain alcohol dehydrogenase family [Nonomuraea jiangxiensis]